MLIVLSISHSILHSILSATAVLILIAACVIFGIVFANQSISFAKEKVWEAKNWLHTIESIPPLFENFESDC